MVKRLLITLLITGLVYPSISYSKVLSVVNYECVPPRYAKELTKGFLDSHPFVSNLTEEEVDRAVLEGHLILGKLTVREIENILRDSFGRPHFVKHVVTGNFPFRRGGYLQTTSKVNGKVYKDEFDAALFNEPSNLTGDFEYVTFGKRWNRQKYLFGDFKGKKVLIIADAYREGTRGILVTFDITAFLVCSVTKK